MEFVCVHFEVASLVVASPRADSRERIIGSYRNIVREKKIIFHVEWGLYPTGKMTDLSPPFFSDAIDRIALGYYQRSKAVGRKKILTFFFKQ